MQAREGRRLNNPGYAIRVGDTVLIGGGSLFLSGVVLSLRRFPHPCLSGYRELCLVQMEDGRTVQRWDEDLRPAQTRGHYDNHVVPMTALEQMEYRHSRPYHRFK